MKSELDLSKVLTSVDGKDANTFASYFTDDAVFRFGSQEPVQGRQAVRDCVAGFFDTIAALSHRVIETWKGEESLVCRGEVTYTKHDGARVTVPFTNILKLSDGRIHDYLVYVDPTPLMS
jgi:ketosteroid isomerase-like protein